MSDQHSALARSSLTSKALFGLLLFSVTVSALAVIYGSYESRRLFHSLQELERRAVAFEVQWRQLLVEEGTLSSPYKIEKLASDKLQMLAPEPGQTVLVQP